MPATQTASTRFAIASSRYIETQETPESLAYTDLSMALDSLGGRDVEDVYLSSHQNVVDAAAALWPNDADKRLEACDQHWILIDEHRANGKI